MQMSYVKMHGTGNQILIVDARGKNFAVPDESALRRMADTQSGPGFDQLMWINDAAEARFEASYRVFNADGGEVQQCGNGVRCVARYLAQNSTIGDEFTLESPAGLVATRINDDGSVSVSMGQPEFTPALIPFLADDEAALYKIESAGEHYAVAAVSMGNPHCILDVDDIDVAPVADLGATLEQHFAFPERTNVGFAEYSGRDSIRLRVFERGVGETAACGTGACAAVVSGQRRGLLNKDVTVQLPGGQVMVSWRGDSSPVWLTGNAEFIRTGTMELDL